MTSFNQPLGILLATCFLITPFASFAEETETTYEEILIPLSGDAVKAKQNDKLPVRGMSMKSVLAKYGEPQKTHIAKGKPPITRWDYTEFSVYFESKSVIHTVNHSN